jgi:hypothetical protein
MNMTSDELRALLELMTNYSFEYLQSLDKEQLQKLYEEKTNGR